VRLFADDTIAYLTISSDQDARTLQSDLDKLEKWETSWLMAFSSVKVIYAKNLRSSSQSGWSLRNIHISKTKLARVDKKKSWYTLHIQVNKGNNKITELRTILQSEIKTRKWDIVIYVCHVWLMLTQEVYCIDWLIF
jgi:hypothetical protein